MDPQANEQHKLALTSQLDSQRSLITLARDQVTQEMSLSLQLKRSITSKPVPWAIGAAGAAGFLALLLRRPRNTSGVVHKSKIGVLLGIGFAMAKPALTKWAVDRLKLEVENRFLNSSDNSMLGENR